MGGGFGAPPSLRAEYDGALFRGLVLSCVGYGVEKKIIGSHTHSGTLSVNIALAHYIIALTHIILALTHIILAVTHYIGSHTHYIGCHTHYIGSHSHYIGSHTDYIGSHTH